MFLKFIDILYPRFCALCNLHLKDNKSRVLCEECEGKLEFIGNRYCKKCGISLSEGFSDEEKRCPDCSRFNLKFKRAVAVGRYAENFKELILQLKFRRGSYLARYLGKLLAKRLESEDFVKDIDLIVPVPMKKWKVIVRGYNQSELLAREVSHHLGIRFCRDCIVKVKSTPAQSSLTGYERLANIIGAFEIKRPHLIKNKIILLIDDVYTTGSTVNECARILLKNGAKEVYVAVVARS